MERATGTTSASAARGDAAALARATQLARPVALAADHLLPVVDALVPLLPDGGLRRGSTVQVHGPAATSLALALAAGPSVAGSWVAVLGLASLGLAAAAEAGVALSRLVLVAAPAPAEWAKVLATLLDGVDVVLLAPPSSIRPGDVRRLQARARERGAVVVVVEPGATGPPRQGGLEPDVVLGATESAWHGLEQGAGHLQGRQVVVEAVGRRAAARPRRVALWLPDASGAPAAVEADVVRLRGA